MQTLLIVDDHEGFRAVARTALAAVFTVIGETGDGASVLALAAELDPDVVLLDIQLPDIDGFAVAAALSHRGSRPQVVLTSTLPCADVAPLLRDSPAVGFIEKDQLSATVLRTMLGSA